MEMSIYTQHTRPITGFVACFGQRETSFSVKIVSSGRPNDCTLINSMQGFEVLSKLGEGAYSTVFKVRRKADGCIYALKQVKIVSLNDKEKSNALNEIRILASVRHPNVISYKEAFFDNQQNSLW